MQPIHEEWNRAKILKNWGSLGQLFLASLQAVQGSSMEVLGILFCKEERHF